MMTKEEEELKQQCAKLGERLQAELGKNNELQHQLFMTKAEAFDAITAAQKQVNSSNEVLTKVGNKLAKLADVEPENGQLNIFELVEIVANRLPPEVPKQPPID